MRTSTKSRPKTSEYVCASKSAAQIQGGDVIALIGGKAALQAIERDHKHPATAYQAAWVEHRKRAGMLLKRITQKVPIQPDHQGFDGLDIYGAAYGILYCVERVWLSSDAERYVTCIPLSALCDLVVEVAREVLAKPNNGYINGVKWYLNGMEFDYGTRGDVDDAITAITRSGTDRRHCHTVDRY